VSVAAPMSPLRRQSDPPAVERERGNEVEAEDDQVDLSLVADNGAQRCRR
jgi:hypothetical protein